MEYILKVLIVIASGITRINIIVIFYSVCGMMDVMVGVLRGVGYSVVPTIISLIGACGLRLLWIWTFFQMPQFNSIERIYVIYPASWVITLLTDIICYVIIKVHLNKKWGLAAKDNILI